MHYIFSGGAHPRTSPEAAAFTLVQETVLDNSHDTRNMVHHTALVDTHTHTHTHRVQVEVHISVAV